MTLAHRTIWIVSPWGFLPLIVQVLTVGLEGVKVKAAFIQRDCLLRGNGYDPANLPEDWSISPDALRPLQGFQEGSLLSVLIGQGRNGDRSHSSERRDGELTKAVAEAINATGTSLDVLMTCPHDGDVECTCWGPDPGYLYEAARRLDLRLDECYLLADSPLDVDMSYLTGCRAIFVLGGRSLEEIFGDQPKHKDFAVATDLPVAGQYIRDEEAIVEQSGPRQVSAPPMDLELMDSPESLPEFSVLSERAEVLQPRAQRPRLQPREVGRWLLTFMAGGVGLSLGIAYLLTHLYRQQAFPVWVRYVTLQFIPRQYRGVLFIAAGLVVLWMAARRFYETYGNGGRRRETV